MVIVNIGKDYKEEVENIASARWGGTKLAVHRQLFDLRYLPCLIAISEQRELLGYCYYRIADNECEIIAIESVNPNIGVGSSLIARVIKIAIEGKCKRVYLATTNDNTHAFRFYQRRGFILNAVRLNELDYLRKIKPTIPIIGEDDIPLKHEFEFEIVL